MSQNDDPTETKDSLSTEEDQILPDDPAVVDRRKAVLAIGAAGAAVALGSGARDAAAASSKCEVRDVQLVVSEEVEPKIDVPKGYQLVSLEVVTPGLKPTQIAASLCGSGSTCVAVLWLGPGN